MATGNVGGRKANRQAATSPRRLASGVAKNQNSSPPIITLLTDFGIADHFVAAMKGVILTESPNVRIVDLTHQIPAQDISAAAFSLLAAFESFPPKTIHVAVVDPGVGSKREAMVAEAAGQIFVGPNNGIFTYIFERHVPIARAITSERWFRHPVSPTFHGRDVFAPVAAAIARGEKLSSFGPRIDRLVKLPNLAVEKSAAGKIRGRIIHIDHFGNCITNFTKTNFPETERSTVLLNERRITSFRRFFSDDQSDQQRVFAYWGSVGFLEIAVKNGSAAKLLKVRVGDPVTAFK
jgi:S-adenosylmethionine hydrolase